MNILFLGSDTGNAKQRVLAMRRLGHTVHCINPERFVPSTPILSKLQYESGSWLFRNRISAHIMKTIKGLQFDITWVDSGRSIGPGLVRQLRYHGPVVNYMNDDPFGKRDRYAWLLYRKTIPYYDLILVPRVTNIAEGYRLGARLMVRRFFTADEVAHAPRLLTPEDHARWDSEVVFVGTWMPERGPFMADLVRSGVPLTIYGNRWQKAREWPMIQRAWRGHGITNDEDYAKAIQCAKICLGMLSKGNRDLHTIRSLEVPALGGLLCAERTIEHQEMYTEGAEAVFWSNAAECANVCHDLLANDERRSVIAHAGRMRMLQDGHFNERMLIDTLAQLINR